MDDFGIDSHKLIYHISRVHKWLNGENIYPIYLELSPSGACNHRCTFCALDYLHYKPQFIDKGVLNNFLIKAAELGVKSVMYSGEGEPFLHPEIDELIIHAKQTGLDVSVTTNGVHCNENIISKCLSSLSWIRFSLNAGTASTYQKIHRCKPDDFKRVLDNLQTAVRVRGLNHYPCTIGVQLTLIPENAHEISLLAPLLKNIGVDYLTIKPFSPHPMSCSKISANMNHMDYLYTADNLKQLSNENFKIIFRDNAINKMREKKPYKNCLGLPFFAYISSDGNIYACSTFLGNNKFCYGNIYQNSFSEIWESACRHEILNFMSTELNPEKCRQACRLDEINRYLWELKYPSAHVNFI